MTDHLAEYAFETVEGGQETYLEDLVYSDDDEVISISS
jgi:hypothetical protein